MSFCEAFTCAVVTYWFARLLLAVLTHPQGRKRGSGALR